MIISRLHMNPRRRSTLALIRSRAALHGAVYRSFPPGVAQDERVLWRLDTAGDTPTLYVLSPTKPDLRALHDEVGWDNDTAQSRDYTPVLDNIAAGTELRYTIAVQPLRKNHAGKRQVISGLDEHVRWFADLALRTGFEISTDSISTGLIKDVAAVGDGRRIPVTHTNITGHLRVRDTEQFRTAMTRGIGRSRAYGMGMLVTTPA